MHYIIMVTESTGNELYVGHALDGMDEAEFTIVRALANRCESVADAAQWLAGCLTRGEIELCGNETVEFVPVEAKEA